MFYTNELAEVNTKRKLFNLLLYMIKNLIMPNFYSKENINTVPKSSITSKQLLQAGY